MNNDVLLKYVRDEQARGVSVEALRLELIQKGWDATVIESVLQNETSASPAIETRGTMMLSNSFASFFDVQRICAIGVAFFLVSSAILYVQGAGDNLANKLMFSLFSITHVFNGITAAILFYLMWKYSQFVWYRIWIGVLSVPIILFATTSLLHFISLATGNLFFDSFVSDILDFDYFSLVIYFVFLPLQAVVFLLLLITLWTLRFVRKKRGEFIDIKITSRVSFTFFVIALLALVDLYLVMANVRF